MRFNRRASVDVALSATVEWVLLSQTKINIGFFLQIKN
jgi:hypothetical protein